MKKFLVLILTLAMVMAMATTAMAAPEILNPNFDATPVAGNTSSKDVTVTVDGGTVATVYQVDVTWGTLAFSYDFGTGAQWDPATHTYEEATGGWNAGKTSTIVLENHSNAEVDFSAKFGTANSSTEDGVTATLTNYEGTLPSADADAYRNLAGPQRTINLELSGTPTVTSGTIDVGTITVTLSKHV